MVGNENPGDQVRTSGAMRRDKSMLFVSAQPYFSSIPLAQRLSGFSCPVIHLHPSLPPSERANACSLQSAIKSQPQGVLKP